MGGGIPWPIYKGWAHIAVTGNCARHLLSVYDNNLRYNDFMRHRFPPDEIYIHTVIHNSEFKSRVSEYKLTPRPETERVSPQLNLTYFEYPDVVAVFSKADELEGLRKSGALFVRKVTLPESLPLLDRIDTQIVSENNEL